MIHLTGMSAVSGEALGGLEHLRQSIWDILTTRRGERIMRPEYGSRLHELIDQPVNAGFLVDLYYECVVAIHRWEPRVRVVRIAADAIHPGRVTLDLIARVDGSHPVVLGGIEIPL
jgi:uncharacterized protein